MKYVAWAVAAFLCVAGVTAIAAPGFVLSVRSFEASQIALLVIAGVRIAIGVVLIMSAPASRTPRVLQAAGAIVMLAGLATPFFGVERTRALLQWEASLGPALMRAGGVVAVALGGFLAFSLRPRRV